MGMKPRTAAKRSDTVSPQTTKRTVMTETKPRKSRPLRILNMSWNSIPNFFRPIETVYRKEAKMQTIRVLLYSLIIIHEYDVTKFHRDGIPIRKISIQFYGGKLFFFLYSRFSTQNPYDGIHEFSGLL